jgi:hypothetical protein
MRALHRIALAVTAMLVARPATAIDYNWTTGTSDNWSNAAAWTPGSVPGAGDTATIAASAPGTYTVTVDSAQAADSVLVANANAVLLTNGGTLTVGTLNVTDGRYKIAGTSSVLSLGAGGATVSGSGFFEFSDGTVGGTGPINVNIANGFSWDNGTLQTTLNLNNGGALVSGLGTKVLDAGGALNLNGGTTTFQGNIKYVGAGAVVVASGATLDWQTDSTISKDATFAGTAVLAINGTFQKSASADNTSTVGTGLTVTNSGTVRAEVGTLRFDSGIANSGTLQADAGATLLLRTGTTTLNAGSQVAGAGTFQLQGATATDVALDLQADTTLTPTFAFNTGTVQGTKTLTVAGPLNWSNGTAGGSATVLAQGGGSVTGNGTVTSGTMNLAAGTYDWTAGNITFNGDGQLVIGSGATLANAGNHNFTYTSGSPTVQLNGTLTKTGGGGAMFIPAGLTLNNAGTAQVTSGSFDVKGTWNNAGTVDLGSGTTMHVDGGTLNLNAGSALTGTGMLVVDNAGSTVTVNAAVTSGPGLTFSRGVLGGSGTLTINGPFNWGVFDSNSLNTVTINAAAGGDWTSSGTRRIGTGTVNLTGGTFNWSDKDISFTDAGTLTVGAAATLDVRDTRSFTASAGITPTITNNGTIVAHGNLQFGQPVTLTGTGTVSVAPGGTLTVNKSGMTVTVPAGMTLTNSGTVVANAGTLLIDPGATLSNYSGGTLTGGMWQASNATIDLGGRSVSTVAAGTTVIVQGSTAAITGLNGLTQNNGTVRILSGATVSPPAGVNTAGVFEVGSGTTFSAGVTVQSGGTLTGRGTIAAPVTVQAGGTVSPGPGPGAAPGPGQLTLDTTRVTGGTYVWELNSWSATANAGSNFDQLRGSSGVKLDLSGVPGSGSVTLKVASLTGSNVPGLIPSFDNTQSRSWVIADYSNGNATGGVQGFAADQFTIDTSGFQNSLGGGTFSLAADGNSNELILTFTPVPEPGTALLAGALGLIGAASARRGARRR